MNKENYDKATELFVTITEAEENIKSIETLFLNMNSYKQAQGENEPPSGYIQILNANPNIYIPNEGLVEKILLEIKDYHIGNKNEAQKELKEL